MAGIDGTDAADLKGMRVDVRDAVLKDMGRPWLPGAQHGRSDQWSEGEKRQRAIKWSAIKRDSAGLIVEARPFPTFEQASGVCKANHQVPGWEVTETPEGGWWSINEYSGGDELVRVHGYFTSYTAAATFYRLAWREKALRTGKLIEQDMVHKKPTEDGMRIAPYTGWWGVFEYDTTDKGAKPIACHGYFPDNDAAYAHLQRLDEGDGQLLKAEPAPHLNLDEVEPRLWTQEDSENAGVP